VEHAVDAVSYAQTVRRRLQVDVARARAQRLEDENVDELDDRSLVRERPEVVERAVLVGAQDLEVSAAQIGGRRLGRSTCLCGDHGGVDLPRGNVDGHDATHGVDAGELVEHRRVDRRPDGEPQHAIGDR
jgi:septum formation topological specificity factor MinE